MSASRLPPAETRGNTIGAVDRALTRLVTGAHRRLLLATKRRTAATMGGHPILVLHTTGHRTGRPRDHPVIGISDGENWLIVASNGGAAQHPDWVHNLLAHPLVSVDTPRGRLDYRAPA